jgi:hypothetical protein
MGSFSTLCDNQCLLFVGVLPDKALKTIFPENYRLHLNFVTFPHILGEQQQLFKEGECNSPLQSYHCANGRGAPWSVSLSNCARPKCHLHISTKLRCTKIIPILLPSTQKPEEPQLKNLTDYCLLITEKSS